MNFCINQKDWVARGAAVLALAGAAMSGAPAYAATQGTIGATSTGSVAITATVPNRARISGLTDVAFTSVDPAVDAASSQGPCVWSNTATRKYTIVASGSGTTSAFTLTDGTVAVPYSVGWAATSGATTLTSLATGTASAAFTATGTNITCSGGADSTLKVSILAGDLQNMVATNSYTGTLTLVVTPQ